jgi:hypothetical protein
MTYGRPSAKEPSGRMCVWRSVRPIETSIRLGWRASFPPIRPSLPVRRLLPAGTSLKTAASGFASERQFLLAEHVAHDLKIPFAQLKAKITGTDPVTLKSAVRALRPDLSSSTVKADLKVASQETKTDVQATGEPIQRASR